MGISLFVLILHVEQQSPPLEQSLMFFFLILVLPFLLIFKTLPLKSLPPWAKEMRLLSVLCLPEFAYLSVQWVKNCKLFSCQFVRFPSSMPARKKSASRTANVEEMATTTILDLPELALECILGKLSPEGLCSMACVCSSLRDRCRGDHLWERHMSEKWGRVIGPAVRREWELYMASRKDSLHRSMAIGKPKGWMEWSLFCVWPFSWFESKTDVGNKIVSTSAADSIMLCYLALLSGRFWFPAQVYNRENGNAGFMLSCYDAELSYDCLTDTFHARYPPHGRRLTNIEEGVQWDRLRAPPVDTPSHDIHVSDCLNELHPGDHIEIQWRKNQEFPYGWWYGVVGHLESCDRNVLHCHCHDNDTVILEFNQYRPGTRWRRAVINRNDHREEGNETDGFYGGIRKLHQNDEITTWRQLLPAGFLE